jgi:hypothetical protein
MKNVWLVGCEESQIVCKAIRDAGIEAYSCDIQPTRGNQEWHYQQDIMEVIPTRRWAGIILHPDCTAMAVSGNRWYGAGLPKHHERIEAITWTLRLWELAKKHSDKVVLENPVSVIFPYLRRAGADIQYVQPHDFGHGETKNTGLALHNLPRLVPTDKAEGREQRIWKMPPGPNRKRDRSETFPGIAKAFVLQWCDT